MKTETKPLPIKRGSRTLGHLHTNEDGSRFYLARRKISDMYRGTEKSLSAAIRAGTAAWGIDEETLFKMRSLGVEQIGVDLKETGERYLAPLDIFFTAGSFFSQARARGTERCVSVVQFSKSPSRIRF